MTVLGFCQKKMHKGRIAIPIHDLEENLVAYAGRWAADPVPEGEPRYKLPPGFHKSLVVYNAYRLVNRVDSIVLVESFMATWWLHQNGFLNVASGTSSSVSGGLVNTASGYRSSVSGGSNNTAAGSNSTVLGGSRNITGAPDSPGDFFDPPEPGEAATVTGGQGNVATEEGQVAP